MTTCRSSSQSAFSLIELSIVLLVIGILIAGIVVGNRMINKFAINSANSQTRSSPVPSIPNLVAWYETSSKDSFEEGISGGDAVSTWFDIGVQNIKKSNAVQTTSSNQPIYTLSAINKLPAIKFDGVDDRLASGSMIPGLSSYTIFIVERRLSDATGYLISTATGTFGLQLGYLLSSGTNSIIQFHRNGTNDSQTYAIPAYSASSQISRILTFTNKVTSSTYGIASIHINGVQKFSNQRYSYGEGSYFLGGGLGGGYYNGYIGEIIIYDRLLRSDEKSDVENYLSKKWKISLG